MIEFESIEDFCEFVKTGNVDESELAIVIDGNCAYFYVNNEEVIVGGFSGYDDTMALYSILFPKAIVDWC